MKFPTNVVVPFEVPPVGVATMCTTPAEDTVPDRVNGFEGELDDPVTTPVSETLNKALVDSSMGIEYVPA